MDSIIISLDTLTTLIGGVYNMEMPKRVSIDCNSKNIPTSSRRLLYMPLKPGELRPTKTYFNRHFGRFFSDKSLLSTSKVLGCYFMLVLHQKWGKNYHSTPMKLSVNTLNNLV